MVNGRIFVIGSMMCPYLVIFKSSVECIKFIKCLVEIILKVDGKFHFVSSCYVKQRQPWGSRHESRKDIRTHTEIGRRVLGFQILLFMEPGRAELLSRDRGLQGTFRTHTHTAIVPL